MSSLGTFAVVVAFLLPVSFSPSVYATFWTPKAAILLVVVGVGIPTLGQLVVNRDRPSVLALAFLAAAAASALLSTKPALAIFGSYNHGTGLLFYIAVVAAWAIGRATDDLGRRRLLTAFVAAMVISSVAAVAQTLFDLSEFQLGRVHDRADAFMGNPVHLGAATAGAIGIVTWWTVREGRRVHMVLLPLFAAALELSGSRFAVVAAAGLVIAVVRGPSWRGAIAVVLLLIGFATGGAIAAAAAAPSGTSRAASVTSSALTPRIEMWKAATRAIADRPFFGFGPGRFREATGRLRTTQMARAEGPDKLFLDAHNVVAEVAVTTGLLGLLLALAWLGLASSQVSGPFAAAAAGILCLTLVQPLSVSTVPVGMLLLAAGSRNVERITVSKSAAAATAFTSTVAVLLAATLLVGDFLRRQAELDFDRHAAHQSAHLLGVWPEPHQLLSKIALYESIIAVPDDPVLLRQSIRFQKDAAERDPSDPSLWVELGLLNLRARDFDAAADDFRLALQADPQSLNAWVGLGRTALATGQYDKGIAAFERAAALSVTPEQRRAADRRLADAKAAKARHSASADATMGPRRSGAPSSRLPTAAVP